MRFAICNEMFRDWPMERIADKAAALGYHGVEIAPFTLSDTPASLTTVQRKAIRTACESRGLAVCGLHWLLAGPGNYSVSSPDEGVKNITRDLLRGLANLCADLGGEVLVFGSPRQRSLAATDYPRAARIRIADFFRSLLPDLAAAGVTMCFEPLTSAETNFINTMHDAVDLVRDLHHPFFKLHLDVKAMRLGEHRPPADIIREEGGRFLHHFHANDPNLLGPGMGDEDQAPIGKALRDVGYKRWVSVETFIEGPGPEETARRSMESLRENYA